MRQYIHSIPRPYQENRKAVEANTNSPVLDKIRSYARRAAWYDNEGENTHNPFKKIRVNRRRKQNATRDIEQGVLARGGNQGNSQL